MTTSTLLIGDMARLPPYLFGLSFTLPFGLSLTFPFGLSLPAAD